MTSMSDESVATILCTCKQTRFNIGTPNYRELDVEGLNITVAAGAKPGAKGKAKAKADGLEILSNAQLRLKAGQRYALVGRNGTGKSTLLKAIAEKLIPGIPEETRVVILQQTDVADASTDEIPSVESHVPSSGAQGPSALEEVIDRATAKQQAMQDIEVLSSGVDGQDPYGALRAYRKIKHARLQRELFLKDKDARLRSGARGLQARKALVAMEKTVAEYEAEFKQSNDEIAADTLAKETSEAAEMLADLQLQVEPSKLAEIESQAKKILAGLGFSEVQMQRPMSTLSGGWKMRAALAAALLQETDILILDEPTNYLDLLGIMWLQRHLSALEDLTDPPTLVLVSHDRDFISLCSDLIIIKEKGLTYFHGDLPMYESSIAEKKVYLTKMKEAKDKQKAHIQQSIVNNMRQGKAKDDQNKIRQAKSRQKKLDDRWGLEVSAKGGRFKLNRDLEGFHLTARADIDIPPDERRVSFIFPAPPELRPPGALLSLEKVSFRYPPLDKKSKTPMPLVLQDITLSVNMGDRIGILGLNGGGKSTMIKLLVGETKQSSGTLETHPRLRLGYYSQHAVEILQRLSVAEPELTSLALLTREVAGELEESDLRELLGLMGLQGRIASDVPVRKLSGGQLVRLEMARILWKHPHCLVLDEATTHLDYETVTAMREALSNWEGAVVVVSHDRWFVRGVVEGIKDDEDSEEDEDDEDDSFRRRAVYRIKGGHLNLLSGGVQEFEDVLEKRVRKMANS